MSKSPTVMLHLTKTAGGTLKDALIKCSELNVEFLYGKSDQDRLGNVELDDVDMIYGHSTFGVHQKIGLTEGTRYMCFMRHPITRTISHYHHLRNVDEGPIGDKIRQSQDINDFFENYNHWEFSNFMVKVISGIGNSKPEPGINIYRTAVANIDTHFDFIGFQEFFPLSLQRLSTVLNAKLAPEKDINIGRYTLDATDSSTISRILDLNKSDMRLYKYALKKFL